MCTQISSQQDKSGYARMENQYQGINKQLQDALHLTTS
jgi:hypothetical protein